MSDRQPTLAYHRILLKISGEALQGEKSTAAIDAQIVDRIASELIELNRLGVEVAVVVGGGNFFRGVTMSALGLDRITADQMGMVSTVVNALALRDAIERTGITTSIMSTIPMSGIVDHYDRRKALHHLKEHRILLFAGGTGNPLVTTDSAASLRSIEIQADVLLKATNVDGVYSSDPAKNPDAKLYTHLTFQEALKNELGVMDLTAFCQCRDNNMPIRVFNIHKAGSLRKILLGEPVGTLVNHGTSRSQ